MHCVIICFDSLVLSFFLFKKATGIQQLSYCPRGTRLVCLMFTKKHQFAIKEL